MEMLIIPPCSQATASGAGMRTKAELYQFAVSYNTVNE